MAEYRQGKVTQGIFDAVKILFENGGTGAEIARFMKLSEDTVGMIKASENYDDYKALMYAKSSAWRKKRAAEAKAKEQAKQEEQPVQIVEHRQTVTVQATWQMTQEMQKTNELLKQISSKLAFIIDELCGTKGGENAEQDH